ncbi:class I SAM-dependent methyltransferase [Marinobacterium sediminicola]|uniref:Methyltransferase domain-containing protein n=1 Tax=Marinobacterium sediminicola TaxID=518898 RepID=A0ABY1S3N0_9GAMM|nr:class I SAM-dependent methyltransferase [Marinobacterium sediminicola]ULG69847.1 class I SAM-dependent methyltransferase [Marinobacterium sediminicola]SMR77873.1 Methyltransferase domain-containing protein [Marinobacterium sediminicola]
MLNYHLNQETDLASRKIETIDLVVQWINSEINFAGKRVCDLGCGPGLYTERFAKAGASVTGVDFSANSINYAKKHSGSKVTYLHADYLEGKLPTGFDVVTLIYCDLCALSPTQRQLLLHRMKGMLNTGGRIVFDVMSDSAIANRKENSVIEQNFMGGFWSSSSYIGLQKTFIYPKELLVLDRFMIVEPRETWEIFNWFQHFSLENIRCELEHAGFQVDLASGGLTGQSLTGDSDQIGIIASLK